MSCIDKVSGWIDTHHLIEPPEKVIAAVSGGPDSMALLTILAEIARKRGFELAVAHFNHGLRPEALRDAALVERSSKALGLPVFIGSGDVPAEARTTRKGVEETARLLRHRFLEETARAWGADKIALGHTRDDQVETILHHIIRGSGWRGLRGMSPQRGMLVRPLLSCRRAELIDFLKRRRVRYVMDASNRDTTLLRNRIRRRLIPYLRKRFNPSIDEAIVRLAANLEEGWATLESDLSKLIPKRNARAGVRIPVSRLSALSDFQIYLFVDLLLGERFGVVQDVERSHFDAVKRLIRSSTSGKRTVLPHGVVVSREHATIHFSRGDQVRAARAELLPAEVLISGPGRYPLPSWRLSIEVARVKLALAPPKSTAREAVVSSIRFPLRVRARRPGDRIIPFGMKGRKKLSDLFIDRKIPASQRESILVFEDRDGILWVPGVAAAERTRVPAGGRRAFRITVRGARREI